MSPKQVNRGEKMRKMLRDRVQRGHLIRLCSFVYLFVHAKSISDASVSVEVIPQQIQGHIFSVINLVFV